MNNEYNENENKVVNEEASAEEVKTDAEQATEIPAAAAPAAKKKGGKRIIGAVVALAVVAIALIAALVIANSPAVLAKRAFDRALNDMTAREEITYLSSLLSGGSVDLSVSGELDGADLDVGGKIYVNAKDREFMLDNLNFKMELEGEKRELSGSLYTSQKQMYVTNGEILDGTYGIARGSLAEGLEDSIFHPECDSEYALDEETYDLLLSVCKIADGDLPEDLEKDLTEVLERYSKTLEKSIKKHAQFEKSNEKIRLHDGSKNLRVVYVIITPKTIKNVMQDLYDYLEADKKLRDLVVKYYDSFAEILEFSGYADEDFDIEDAYDDAIEEFGEMVEDVADAMEDGDEDMFLSICIATPKTSAKALKVWAITGEDIDDMDDKDETTELFYIDFGKAGIKNSKEIVIKVTGIDEKIKYIVDTEEKGTVEYKLKVGSEFKVSFELNKKDEKFKMSFTEYSDTFALEGKYTTKGDKSTFELNKIKVDGETLEDFDLDVVVTLDESDKMHSPEKKFTSVFELTEEDITEIIERAEEWVGIEYNDDPNTKVGIGWN